MRKVAKYQLCVSGGTENLMDRVRILIEDGWVPVGGVAQFKDEIIQAMVLPEKREQSVAQKREGYSSRKAN
jgi:hypothetical protein